MTSERRQPADAFVVFGITGDLAHKMLIPALYALESRRELTVPVVGVALTDLDVDGLRDRARDSLRDAGVTVDESVFGRLAKRLSLIAGSFTDETTFESLHGPLAGWWSRSPSAMTWRAHEHSTRS
jgi:glucose-6-phosphate 1-dehydrogenase